MKDCERPEVGPLQSGGHHNEPRRLRKYTIKRLDARLELPAPCSPLLTELFLVSLLPGPLIRTHLYLDSGLIVSNGQIPFYGLRQTNSIHQEAAHAQHGAHGTHWKIDRAELSE